MEAPPARERKRRKWDVTAPPSGSQPPAAPPASGGSVQLDAAAIVARINAELREKGVAAAQKFAPVEPPKEIFREITFNDAPSSVRQQLTKRHCQEDIQRRTGTVLIVRGRYYPPGMPVDDKDKPLFLRISPTATAGDTDEEKQRAVDAAAGEVQKILQGQPPLHHAAAPRAAPPQQGSYVAVKPGSYAAVPPPGQAAPPASYNAVPFPGQGPTPAVVTQQQSTGGELQVVVGFSAPSAFGLAARLTGPAGGYLAHISRETGAQVSLRGRGAAAVGGTTSAAPLHICVTAPTPKAAEDARQLAQNLIDTTRTAAEQEFPGQVRYDFPPASGGTTHGFYGAPPPHHFMPQQPIPYAPPGAYLHNRPMPPPYPAYPVPPATFPPQQPIPPPQQHYQPPQSAPLPTSAPPQQPPPVVGATTDAPPPKRRFSEGNVASEPPAPVASTSERVQSSAPSVPMGPPPPRKPKTDLRADPAPQPVEKSADAGVNVLPGLVDYAGDEE